jgi:tRNA-specific 2-thiouridylase
MVENDRPRIVVAMSGGVDSSVAAGLLKQQGYDVIGVTLQLYDHGNATARPGTCCAGQDIHDARRVAQHLDIPHYVLDYEARFRSAVIETFADSYAAGETPIPCVACNQSVKFLDLLDTAEELGASALATGHYIERRDTDCGAQLYRGPDSDRDQSYFLFATTPHQLARLRFPLGTMHKGEVRQLAADMGLPVATKNDSQDICFVPDGSYADIVARLRPDAVVPGPIVDLAGNHLGEHKGIIHYTIGQRRGLGIASGEPLYVVRLDAASHRVVVGPREALLTTSLVLRDVNWLGEASLQEATGAGLEIAARIRSSQPPRPAILHHDPIAGRTTVELVGGEHGVAAGQACVFYEDESTRARLLGGGWIAKTGSDSIMARPPAARQPAPAS